ncbi:hypothetical protein NEK97_05940 [Paenarthrobacter sp. UW852]|uniref:hypothetical protein n=1 Tax=Paenarthrobacter sp. UW852 TaxID=2951989 RepID=UPI002149162F|nr:hypothetical protein [Paenarthrobacter sp. UW852]MCR1160997.1 hypothetical protein [Paenarthrobacter sp. UW852]
MIASTLGSWAATALAKLGSVIEAAYVMDCAGPESGSPGSDAADLTWLPALSGVTVAGSQAIQSHASKPGI